MTSLALSGANPAGTDLDHSAGSKGARRRDFINLAALSFAGFGGFSALAPIVFQMNPGADVLAQATTTVDLGSIAPGQAIKTAYRGSALFVRHLTAKEIAAVEAVPLSSLRDPQTLEQRTIDGKLEWLITTGVCTHAGCIPLGIGQGEDKGAFGGYFCPCHGSQYDIAGRIRKGPAPSNLEVPKYKFTSPTTILVG